jgi:hypothetical protein
MDAYAIEVAEALSRQPAARLDAEIADHRGRKAMKRSG